MDKRWATSLGVLAMVALIFGICLPAGSLIQKIIFVAGAPALGLAAWINGQKMFTSLQLVVTLGAVVVFFSLSDLLRYALMLGAALLTVIWLWDEGHYTKDRWGWLGTLGLVLIALGLATPAASYPVLFFSTLALGGLLVAVYSLTSILGGFRLGWIWLVLNVLFAINPTWQLIRLL